MPVSVLFKSSMTTTQGKKAVDVLGFVTSAPCEPFNPITLPFIS